MIRSSARVQDRGGMGIQRNVRFALLFFLAPLAGCARSGEINLFGAYFPVWLLAILIGAAVAFACRFLFVRFRLEPYLGPPTLIYICITVSVSCLMWLLIA